MRGGDGPADPPADCRSDAELVAAHVAGDRDAFAEVVRRHTPRLWGLAVRTLGDREDAADALQDAFVSAFRAADRFRGDAAVSTWLHRIVVNACLDRLRRNRVRAAVPLDSTAGPGDGRAAERLRARGDDHAAVELRLDVADALAQLPEHQRLALVLVDLHDLSVAEAARVLDVAEGTVKSRCARGRAALAQVLRSAGLGPDGAQEGDGTAASVGGGNPPGSRRVGAPGARAVGEPRRAVGGARCSTAEQDSPDRDRAEQEEAT